MKQPYTEQHRAVLGGMQRLSRALLDIKEEIPQQCRQMLKLPIADALPILDVIEHQLMWLAEDVARLRAGLAPQEHTHED